MSGPRVIEASIRSFICAHERYEPAPFALGALVGVREGGATVFGVVAEIVSGPEDPGRPLQPRGRPGQSAAEVLADEPGLRELLRTRLTVVTCGHLEGELLRAALPPAPPPLLGEVAEATANETTRLAEDGAFLGLLLASPHADDGVVAAAIRRSARAFAPADHEYRVAAGKELARLLRADPARLASILRAVAR